MLLKHKSSIFRNSYISCFPPFGFRAFAIFLIALLLTTNAYAVQATLSWDANTESNLAGYNVHYGTSSGSYDTTVDVGNQTSHIVTGLVSGNSYYFVVTAYDSGDLDSANSSEVVYNAPSSLPVNNPPVLSPIGNKSVNENQLLSFTISSTDSDGDTLNYTVSNHPIGANFDASTGSFSWTPTFDQAGIYSNVTFQVSDGNDTDSESIIITVVDTIVNTNNAPVINTMSPITVNEGDTVTLNPVATDPDGDTLTYATTGWMTTLSYTTTYDDAGVYTVTITVSDGALSDSEDVTITVNNVNRAPVLGPIADITVNAGDTIILNPVANDPDGDILSYTYTGWMTTSSYTTSTVDAGVHTVTVTVSDGLLYDSQDVTIIVNDIDTTPPVITSAGTYDSSQVIVIFNEPIDGTSATDPFNYSIDNAITVLTASLDPDLMTVTLTTTTHTDGSYTLTVNNIRDLAGIPNIIDINTTVSYTFTEQLEISNLTVDSGRIYEVVYDGLQNGTMVYIDRDDTYMTVPMLLEGATYIMTANNDRRSNTSPFLTFDVNTDATVYIAHDDRITTKPSWLSFFNDTGVDIFTTSATLSIYERNFFAGTVVLGGNSGNKKSRMYTAMIVKQSSNSGSDITPPAITSVGTNGSTEVIVAFSEPLEAASATEPLNYNIGNASTVLDASLGFDLVTVTLTTTPHIDGIYTLTVNNIRDLADIPNIIGPNTMLDYTFVTQLEISSLSVDSGRAYEVIRSGLQNGATAYIDRGDTYINVPTWLEGATYIKTANNDRRYSTFTFITFDVDMDATVYVAHDDHIATKPSWLASFTDTGVDISTTSSTLSIYESNFFAGMVTLGGNEGNGKSSMYTVIIQKQ